MSHIAYGLKGDCPYVILRLLVPSALCTFPIDIVGNWNPKHGKEF
jgi:hypothetical protein